MTLLSPSAIDDCVGAVSDTFAGVFAHIEQWRSRIADHVAEHDGVVAAPELDDLIEHLVLAELERDDALIIGAGCVATPGFLADTRWHLAWWLGHSNTFGLGAAGPSVRRLAATEDPTNESFRDYTDLEWWRVPASTGEAHITGPYVDYLCTDDYTLTLTVPVLHEGAMIGVAGILVDAPTDAAPGPDDVLIHLEGATASGEPLRVSAGRRTLFLYDVSARRPNAVARRDVVTVSAGVIGPVTLAGVFGGLGTAAEWAAALAGSTLTQLVPDEHLTPDGSLSLRLRTAEKTAQGRDGTDG
jgi:hypothetical protein